MTRYELADAFCGEGGATVGYRAAGFSVTGNDNNKNRLKYYPFRSYHGDALEFIYHNGEAFDVWHASPPCTGYTRGTAAIPDRLQRYDRLIPEVRELLQATGKPYVIENVPDARSELRDPVQLCWTWFYRAGSVVDEDGTPLQMFRHRLFESNVPLTGTPCNHDPDMQVAGSYGGARRDKWVAKHVRHGGYVPHHTVQRQLMDAHWMTEKGCQLSIPHVYAEHIGNQLMKHLQTREEPC